MEPTRLCMIGAGRHATANIYPCFASLRDAQVVANCDLDLAKARSAATRFGIPASYRDYGQMVEAEGPDAVLVCVGPGFHAAAAVELLGRGLHVYTEKPPATTAADCRKVVAAQRESGLVCMTGFKKRYAPAYVAARQLVASEGFGSPALLSILRTSGHYGNTDNPRSRYILDSGIHAVDLAPYLFGHVTEVKAVRKAPASYAVTLQFAGGAVGTLSLTDRMSYARAWEEVTAIGDGGVCVQVDNSVEMIAFAMEKPIAAHKPNFVAGSSNSAVEQGFVGELRAFVEAVRGGPSPVSSIEEAAHTMEIIEAIEESVRTGHSLEIAT
jgi:predicted dehydrogenase